MTVSVGDKIGLTVPQVGASEDSWGTELNSLFTKLDEHLYAAREDRNNIVVGGGTVSWDETAGELSFDSNIEIHNHITGNKNVITTAASPITLDAAHKVAYVQLSRKPGSDNSITSATVVAAGSLPNGDSDSDHGTFVLAYRTSTGNVLLPWAREELDDGESVVLNRTIGSGSAADKVLSEDELTSNFTPTVFNTFETALSVNITTPVGGETVEINAAGTVYSNSGKYLQCFLRVKENSNVLISYYFFPAGSAATNNRMPWSFSKKVAVSAGSNDFEVDFKFVTDGNTNYIKGDDADQAAFLQIEHTS